MLKSVSVDLARPRLHRGAVPSSILVTSGAAGVEEEEEDEEEEEAALDLSGLEQIRLRERAELQLFNLLSGSCRLCRRWLGA